VAPRNRKHILVNQGAVTEPYTSHGEGRSPARPPSPEHRYEYGQALRHSFEGVVAQGIERRAVSVDEVNLQPAANGIYVTFESFPGFELALTSLDPQRGHLHPELVAVSVRQAGELSVEQATVFVPDGAMGYFLERFEAYSIEDTKKGRPRHQDLVERIANLRLATLQVLWTDDPDLFPPNNQAAWWEIWLRRTDGAEVERLVAYAAAVGAEVVPRQLVFDQRVIVVVRASPTQLARSVDLISDLAELRRAKAPTEFFASLPAGEQAAWAEDLLNRTTYPGDQSPSVCLLDTGVNRGHQLLEQAIAQADVHTCNPQWGTHDHDGHGTEMAGVALYGDLAAAVASNDQIDLRHGLESVKILGPANDNERELFGAITAEAVSRVEVAAPMRKRAFCMAVTAIADPRPGIPTLWSSAVDALAAGRTFDQADGEIHYLDDPDPQTHRLFFVSAGNVSPIDAVGDYLDRCDIEPVQDPAQAWNAVTVGAFTELTDVAASGPDWAGYAPIASEGDLSPFSRTSLTFSRAWPVKPDFVCEGGNCATNGVDTGLPDSIQMLTTYVHPVVRMFTTTGMTSAATAQAGRLASLVNAEYPDLWPETVRALLVHSSEWTTAMRGRFAAAGPGKAARESLLRRYGFGVPSAERALRSAADAVTLVVQDVIHPFANGRLREMHLHSLPWPTDALRDLGDANVRLRVTLSYFIEPVATRRGWRKRFRYPSHGLRFDIKKPLESVDAFRKRVNKLALEEDEGRPAAGDPQGWYFGAQARSRGSLHSDFWEGSAIELAERGTLAIYPVHGWWKEQPSRDRSGLGAAYGLVVSIETPVQDVDLWTPVAVQVGVPIEIAVDW